MNRSTAIKLFNKKCQIALGNKTGSTLIWALIVTLVLGILIASGLVIAQSVVSRAQTQHTEKQAYYTALSATRAVAEWLDGTVISNDSNNKENEQIKKSTFIASLYSNPQSIDLNDFFDSNDMGVCKTIVRLDDNQNNIIISSTATYKGNSSTVDATLKSTTESVEQITGEIESFNPETISTPTDYTQIAGEYDSGWFSEWIGMTIGWNPISYPSISVVNKPSGQSSWQSQYADFNLTSTSSKTVYVKLVKNSSSDKILSIYSGNNFKNLRSIDSICFYTANDNSSPTSTIRFTPNIVFRYTTFLGIKTGKRINTMEQATYNNVILYINDQQSSNSLELWKGVILGGNSYVYTTRNTYVGMPSGSSDGSLTEWGGLTDTNYTSYSTNKSYFNSPIITSINGTFVVAKNTTTFYYSTLMTGTILVKKGATLRLSNGSTVNGNIFVEGGGNLIIENGSTINGNIYGLADSSSAANITSTGTFILNGTFDLQNKSFGGIFLYENEEKTLGAKFTQNGNIQTTQNTLTNPIMIHKYSESTYSYSGSSNNHNCNLFQNDPIVPYDSDEVDCRHGTSILEKQTWTLEGYTTGK